MVRDFIQNKDVSKFKGMHFFSFLSLFVIICLYYNIHQTIFYPPASVHNWRQADVASVTLNYYQNGFQFDNQEFHLNGTGSGRKLTECPILYFFIASLYKILGPNDWVFRGTSLFIVFWGFFAFSRLTLHIVKNRFISLWLPFLFFASPTVAFYSPNFLPNMSAFGLMLIGLYFIYKYSQTHRLIFHFVSMLFFLLAGLLKVSSMIAVIGIFGIYLLELFSFKIFQSEPKLFPSKWKPLLGFLPMFGGVYYWISGTVDLSPLQPIWKLDSHFIDKTYTFIFEHSIPYLFSTPTVILFLIIFVAVLSIPKKVGLKIYLFNLLILLGIVSIFFLIFQPLFIHDYYFIEFLILPISVFTTALFFLSKNHPSIIKHNFLRFVMVLFLIFNFHYTKTELNKRYDITGRHFKHYNPDLLKPKLVRKFLKSHGIEYPESVFVAPDISPNLTLYIMNLRGWSEFSSDFYSLPYEKVHNLAQCCTKYLIITEKEYMEREELQPAFQNLISDYNNSIFIFDIQHLKKEN